MPYSLSLSVLFHGPPRAALVGEGLDDVDTTISTGDNAGDSSRGGCQQQQEQHRELLVPRGLDLLPSMRAPRLLPPPKTTLSNGGGSSSKAGEKTEGTGTVEYVPWIGGSASLGGVKVGRPGAAAAAAPTKKAPAEGIKERVRWFPKGLPVKPTVVGSRGRDERESAMFNTRASMAIDRLGEQVGETTKRQAEIEAKRREKVPVDTDFSAIARGNGYILTPHLCKRTSWQI